MFKSLNIYDEYVELSKWLLPKSTDEPLAVVDSIFTRSDEAAVAKAGAIREP